MCIRDRSLVVYVPKTGNRDLLLQLPIHDTCRRDVFCLQTHNQLLHALPTHLLLIGLYLRSNLGRLGTRAFFHTLLALVSVNRYRVHRTVYTQFNAYFLIPYSVSNIHNLVRWIPSLRTVFYSVAQWFSIFLWPGPTLNGILHFMGPTTMGAKRISCRGVHPV